MLSQNKLMLLLNEKYLLSKYRKTILHTHAHTHTHTHTHTHIYIYIYINSGKNNHLQYSTFMLNTFIRPTDLKLFLLTVHKFLTSTLFIITRSYWELNYHDQKIRQTPSHDIWKHCTAVSTLLGFISSVYRDLHNWRPNKVETAVQCFRMPCVGVCLMGNSIQNIIPLFKKCISISFPLWS